MSKLSNYPGSIELISGITQANNGSYPLAEANAILIDDNDKRLDTKLSEIDTDILNLKNNSSSSGTVSVQTLFITVPESTWETVFSDDFNMYYKNTIEAECTNTTQGIVDIYIDSEESYENSIYKINLFNNIFRVVFNENSIDVLSISKLPSDIVLKIQIFG